jgi:hypothetical protein
MMSVTPPPVPAPDPDDDRLAAALRASGVLEDAPETLVQRAIALFPALPRPALAPQPRAGLPRLLAALRFDSGLASPLAFGRRSTATEQRQLLYTLDACDVDLRVAADDGDSRRFVVSGQLLGPDCQGVVFAQRTEPGAGETDPACAVLNEFGEFRLPPLQGGHWRLTLELADKAIELPPLLLPPGAAPR